MKRRIPIVIAVLLIGSGLAAWALDLPARLGWRGAAPDALTLYGNVDIRQVELGFRVAGRLEAMNFEEGQSVKAGAILAQLDARPYDDKVAAAQAQLAVQTATLSKVEAGPRPAEIAQGRANLAERQADLANARQALERAVKLRPAGAISQAALDDAKAAAGMAVAREAAAQQALALLEEGSRPEDIAAARASALIAKANLEAGNTDLRDTKLLAPADGIILSRVREPGAIVGPSDAVYVLSLTKPVWVRAYIAEPLLGRIHPGMAVTLTSDSAPNRPYHAHIGFISPVAEFTPKSVETPELRTDLVYRLRVIVDDADEGLRQGMPVTVTVPLASQAKAG
ncbi:MAG TPA: secretion protein HlyD [Stellaceae bacterium]|nr:secretion protein HlyD [Stellaceae bacterium]